MKNYPSMNEWHRGIPAGSRHLVRAGIAVLIVSLGGFGVWASVAPLDGAVVVSGTFVASGQNKQVQHLEGGIIREVLVQEGQQVVAGQPVLRLDETAARARLTRLVVRKNRLLILQARLVAESNGKAEFSLPKGLSNVGEDLELKTIYARQVAELNARRRKLADEEGVLKREIAGLRESITGYASQIKSTLDRKELFGAELADKKNLLDRQLARKAEVLAIQRAEASLIGELARLESRAADSQERISRAEQQIAQLHSTALQKVLEDLRSTETELDDIDEQIRAARDVLERVELRAPVSGIIVRLHHHTRGGVIAAGAVIMELLPANDELIIEARLNPTDVSYVKHGLEALVRLSALNQRLTPMIDGKVVYLSADAISQADTKTISSYGDRRDSFLVRVRLDEEDMRRKVRGFQPTPGMPADVFIRTGERTFFEYLMKPVSDSFARAFREH